MVRCDKYYELVERVGNHCGKDDRTFDEIIAYLKLKADKLDAAVAESEILNTGNRAMAHVLTERASRPLIRAKDQNIVDTAIPHIVKQAEENFVNTGNPRVTGREVEEIVRRITCLDTSQVDEDCHHCSIANPREFGCVDCQIGFLMYTTGKATFCPLCGKRNIVFLPERWTPGKEVI